MVDEHHRTSYYCLPDPILNESDDYVAIRLAPEYGYLVGSNSCAFSLFQGPETVVVFSCIDEVVRCSIYDRCWSQAFVFRNAFEPVNNVFLLKKLNLEYPDHLSYLRELAYMKICLSNDSIELPCTNNSEVESGIALVNGLIKNSTVSIRQTLSDFQPIPSSLFLEGGLLTKIRHNPCTTCLTCRPASIEFDGDSLALVRPVFPSIGECVVSLIADAICLPVSCIFPANYVLEERSCLFTRQENGNILCIVSCKKLCYEHHRTVYDGVTGVSYRVETHRDPSDNSDFKVSVLQITHLYGTGDVYLGEYRLEMSRRIAEVQSFIENQGAIRAVSSVISNALHSQSITTEDVAYVELAMFSANTASYDEDATGDRTGLPAVEAATID